MRGVEDTVQLHRSGNLPLSVPSRSRAEFTIAAFCGISAFTLVPAGALYAIYLVATLLVSRMPVWPYFGV